MMRSLKRISSSQWLYSRLFLIRASFILLHCYPFTLRDTLLKAAEAGLYRFHYSRKILSDALDNLVRKGRLQSDRYYGLETAILEAFEDGLVEPTQELINAMTNEPNDRHVVAAAIVAQAQVIVTLNIKDFSREALEPYSIEAQTPDQFLTHLYDLFPEDMLHIIRDQSRSYKKPPRTTEDILEVLRKFAPTFVNRTARGLVA